MRPRRTPRSNKVFSLGGGTEDNDLWVHDTGKTIISVWELTPAERIQLQDPKNNIQLAVIGKAHPPVALNICRAPLGR